LTITKISSPSRG